MTQIIHIFSSTILKGEFFGPPKANIFLNCFNPGKWIPFLLSYLKVPKMKGQSKAAKDEKEAMLQALTVLFILLHNFPMQGAPTIMDLRIFLDSNVTMKSFTNHSTSVQEALNGGLGSFIYAFSSLGGISGFPFPFIHYISFITIPSLFLMPYTFLVLSSFS